MSDVVVVCRPTPDDVTKTSTHRHRGANRRTRRSVGRPVASRDGRCTVLCTHTRPNARPRRDRPDDRTDDRTVARPDDRTTLRGVTAGGAPGWWTDAPNVRDKKEGVYVCMYVYTVLVQIAGGRAECPRHHGGPAGRRAGAHVCACMSIQYKYRQISSGAGATRRVDAPNVRDTTAGRRAGGRACVCVYVYTVQVQTDLFLGHSARL